MPITDTHLVLWYGFIALAIIAAFGGVLFHRVTWWLSHRKEH